MIASELVVKMTVLFQTEEWPKMKTEKIEYKTQFKVKKGDIAAVNFKNPQKLNDESFGSYISINEPSMFLKGTGGTTNLFGMGLLMLN
jgi:hypothetical protein